MSKLTEIDLFAKEEENNSSKSRFQHKKVKSGSDSGIKSIGMSVRLLKKFNKGVAVSTSMITEEINKNVQLKIEILELKYKLKIEKKSKNLKKALKLKMLIKKKKILYHTCKVLRPKGIS